MADNDLVWYVGFGSNILTSRLHCYITGGQPEGSSRSYIGCRDTSLPRQEKPTTVKHELYFSKESTAWENGGVGFVNIEYNDNASTLAKMYLISKQQLEDIAKQETNSTENLSINFDETIARGNSVFKSPSWYGKILFLGNDNGYPVFTLTNEVTLPSTTKPSIAYLRTIIAGIKQSHSVSNQNIVDYLVSKRGVAGNYSMQEITDLVTTTISMVIVIVRWYIKKGKEDEFKNIWKEKMEPKIKDGLFREFFSKPVDLINDKYHTLDVESSHYTTFMNVGIWENVGAFDKAIGSFIPDREEPDLTKFPEKSGKELIEVFNFEFKLRERVVMTVEEDRNGSWLLPKPSLNSKL